MVEDKAAALWLRLDRSEPLLSARVPHCGAGQRQNQGAVILLNTTEIYTIKHHSWDLP